MAEFNETELRDLAVLWIHLPPPVRPLILDLVRPFLVRRADLGPDGGDSADAIALNAAVEEIRQALRAALDRRN